MGGGGDVIVSTALVPAGTPVSILGAGEENGLGQLLCSWAAVPVISVPSVQL